MIINQGALLLCLALLLLTRSAAFRALKEEDLRLARILQVFRLGLSLLACAYVLHLILPGAVLARVASFICTFAGSLLIWLGTLEYINLRRHRQLSRIALSKEEPDDGLAAEIAFPIDAGLPLLNSGSRRVWSRAVEEAGRQHQSCVDTDHLLLGILQEPRSAGAGILGCLDVRVENIRANLGQPSTQRGAGIRKISGDALPLTNNADRVFTLAAQEAHRFGKASVGTDHLLLGLVLMGTGAAAVSLFQEGVTADGIRDEIIKERVA